jgi:DNA-directed RNA polymerase subunit RPC12/RpoP
LHSIVVSGRATALDAAMENAFAKARKEAEPGEEVGLLPSRIVDAPDDNGLPPLFYACFHRQSHAVASLVSAGAKVDFIAEKSLSLAHICALRLDDKSLSTVLASESPRRPDPNALDSLGRTPMYIAATEGLNAGGSDLGHALSRCIMALEAWGGRMFASRQNGPHPVCVLAAAWLPERLSVVLDHVSFRYPVQVEDLGDSPFMSVSALYGYPIHKAIASLFGKASSLKVDDELSPEFSLVRTLRVLLEHGFEPNERMESHEDIGAGHWFGLTPIQCLALVAFGIEKDRGRLDLKSFKLARVVVQEAANLLVACGARIVVESPPASRLRRSPSMGQSSHSAVSEMKQHDAPGVVEWKIDWKNDMFALLAEDEEILREAQKVWAALGPVPVPSCTSLLEDDKASFSETDVLGGSSDKSCAICWRQFGALVNRKHKCRVSQRYVCEDCSSKRLVGTNGSQIRISDGQFLLARVDYAREKIERDAAQAELERLRNVALEKRQADERRDRLADEEQGNRDSLFAGVKNFVFGEEDDTVRETDRSIQGLTASLSDTKNALNERGERLATLGEKSSQMVDASADFARMAKELRKKSEGGLFW